jgi:hypothetical protein
MARITGEGLGAADCRIEASALQGGPFDRPEHLPLRAPDQIAFRPEVWDVSFDLKG